MALDIKKNEPNIKSVFNRFQLTKKGTDPAIIIAKSVPSYKVTNFFLVYLLTIIL